MKVALKMSICLKHDTLDVDVFQTVETKFDISDTTKVMHSFLQNYLTYPQIQSLSATIVSNADDRMYQKYKSLGVYRYKTGTVAMSVKYNQV